MRGYVDVDGGQVHYRAAGSDGPAVVLFHESPRSSSVYTDVLPLLGERVRAVAFDTPGYGLSDPLPAGADFPAYVSVLEQAIDRLGIDTFVPVGMKTGSSIAAELAGRHFPGRVPRAVLYGPLPPPDDGGELWARTWAPPIEPDEAGSHLARLWDKNLGLYGPESPRDLTLAVAETLLNLDHYGDIYPAVFRYEGRVWERTLELVAAGCPLLFLQPAWARMTPEHKIVFAEIPGTQVVRFALSGHLARRDPVRFAQLVLDFVGA
ncbi:MAG TPA: alpha/beta hydrolase [Mycobacteriales bacterium]|nr:alpha/beta hydrolase [Mycobacteriales bacterium]